MSDPSLRQVSVRKPVMVSRGFSISQGLDGGFALVAHEHDRRVAVPLTRADCEGLVERLTGLLRATAEGGKD